jgi:hypothetical protein
VSITVAESRLRTIRVHRVQMSASIASIPSTTAVRDPLHLSFGSCCCIEWSGPDALSSKVGWIQSCLITGLRTCVYPVGLREIHRSVRCTPSKELSPADAPSRRHRSAAQEQRYKRQSYG